MNRPRILDLFCGAGGAAMGYARAGFDVVGIDIRPQPNFPFAFVQADALNPPVDLSAFDLIHASPPCQAYSTMSNRWGSKGLPLIEQTRDLLLSSGRPYVLENVPGAARHLRAAIELTGEMFGLRVHRPRLFECSPFVMAPGKPERQHDPVAVYGQKMDGRRLWTRADGSEQRAPRSLEGPSKAMGIDWMGWDELRESIPPAYTHWIGERMMEAIATPVTPMNGAC